MLNKLFGVVVVLVALLCGSVSFTSTTFAQQQGEVPGQSLGISSDSDLWRFVRTGNAGSTQMKDELAAVMIQSEGDNWRCLLYTSPSPRDGLLSRMPSSA